MRPKKELKAGRHINVQIVCCKLCMTLLFVSFLSLFCAFSPSLSLLFTLCLTPLSPSVSLSLSLSQPLAFSLSDYNRVPVSFLHHLFLVLVLSLSYIHTEICKELSVPSPNFLPPPPPAPLASLSLLSCCLPACPHFSSVTNSAGLTT